MGENQGMVWIILGVIIVGAVILVLGGTMEDSIKKTNDKVDADATSALADANA